MIDPSRKKGRKAGLEAKAGPDLAPWLIVAAALALRLVQLGAGRGLDPDEAYYILLAQEAPAKLLSDLSQGAHPPLYFLCLHYWTSLFGITETAARLLSVVFGTAMVAAIYRVGSRLFSREAGLYAAALACLSPLHVFYSREARMYTLVPLLSLWAFYLLIRALKEDRAKDWAGLALCLCAGAYTHNYGLFLLPAAALAMLLPCSAGRRSRLALALAAAALCYLPWMGTILKQAASPGLKWIGPFFKQLPPWAAVLRSLEVMGSGGIYQTLNYSLSLQTDLRWPAAAVYAILLGKAAAAARRDDTGKIAFSFLLVPLAIPWAVSLASSPIYVAGRYDMIALPFYLLIIAWGISRFTRPWKRAFLSAAIILSAYSLYALYFRSPLMPSRQQADYLRQQVKSGDSIVFAGMTGNAVKVHFLRERFAPDMSSFPSQADRHPGWFYADRRDPAPLHEEARRLAAERWGRNGRVWLVGFTNDWPDSVLVRYLRERFSISRELSKPEILLHCLEPARSVPASPRQ
ncbi:MAG: glycosyltransferase family 39 protein [Pseudomonadota bacterium]